MEWQHWAMIVMFGASAALPLVGLINAYRSATRWSREYAKAPAADRDVMSFGQHSVLLAREHERMKGEPSVALGDIVLIGLGVLIGAAASIWAVIDSVA